METHLVGDDFASRPPRVPSFTQTTRTAMGLAVVAAVAYGSFVLAPWRAGDVGPYMALVVAEVVLLANALGLWWTALCYVPRTTEDPAVFIARRELVSGYSQPFVDVLITVCGEPLEVIERTMRAARDMRLAHATWVCDDARSDEVQALCAWMGVGYLRRADRRGLKAGNVNRALARTSGQFVAFFDADHVPHPDFLVTLLPHMADPQVAFVQGPQHYRNGDGSFVAAAAAESQQLFYEVVCPGKNRFNAAYHVGTNAVFRRSALEEVGGFYEETNSEDIWTSLKLHQRGWRSVYLPHVVALGLAPETVHAYVRQQFRWASGAFEVFFRESPLRRETRLTLDQRLQYLTPTFHFLLGFSNLWFMLLPPLFLLFNIKPLDTDSGTWLAWFLPFYLLSQLVLWLQTGCKLRPVILSVAVAPVHVRAFFAVLLRRKPVWDVTNRKGQAPPVLELLLPQFALLLLNLTGIAVGLAVVQNPTTTTISVTLCTVYVLVLGRIIAHAHLDRRQTGRAAPVTRTQRATV